MEELLNLEGADMDLRQLSQSYPTGPVRVEEREDTYYLVMESDIQRDDADILADSAKVLATMVAIMLTDGANFRSPTIHGITKMLDGKLVTIVNITVSALARSAMFVNVRLIGPDGEIVQNKGPTQDQITFQLARTNEPLRRALVIYGSLPHTWINLYKVLDAIRDGNGGMDGLKAKNFVPASDIEKFKATANSYKALGLEARHGLDEGVPAARMTLQEAQEMFRKLFQAWINELKKQGST
jgi:hypothetical protein